MTVTGMSSPSSANTWVIPTFLPMIPSIAIFVSPWNDLRRSCVVLGAECCVLSPTRIQLSTQHAALSTSSFSERLDLDVHACRQLELHERVDGLRRRLENVEQPLVRPHLELLARLLVDVRAAQNGVARNLRRQ